ncbi:unnamed protein product [Clavelina lepadiformis]|uniref:Secreted protein n=1 Tax=Clavelina lepadiformis TaxID=159417 RepID=A0ABP0FR21_CLALP
MIMKSATIFCVAFLALCALASAEGEESKLEDTFQPKDGYIFDDDSKEDETGDELEALYSECSHGNAVACTDAQIQLLRIELIKLQQMLKGHYQTLDLASTFNRLTQFKSDIKRNTH